MLPERYWVYKEKRHLQGNFICKEKSGAVKKSKLVTKIKVACVFK